MEKQIVIVELNNKGYLSRFALNRENFKKEYPKASEPAEEWKDYQNRPMVYINYRMVRIGDAIWNTFFTDLFWGLSESDIESGNLAVLDEELMTELLQFLP